MKFYYTMKWIFSGIFRLIFRVKVTGADIPAQGSFLICANHTSMLDVEMLVISFKRRFYFMAKKEALSFKPLGAFLRGMGAFPVDRGGADVGSLKKAIALVKEGAAVVIFPQGTRHKYVDPTTTDVKHGVGMIAYHSGCDVIPIYIKTKKNHLRVFRKTELIVGEPIKNSELGFEKGGTKEYKAGADVIFSRICALGGYVYPPVNDEKAEDEEK